jgi:hypothetical protein
VPLPADLATLAGRLGVRTSVQRAVDSLDAFTLRVLEALVIAADAEGLVDAAAAVRLLDGVDERAGAAAVAALLELVLVWGEPGTLHLLPSVREAVGTYPAGLGRPAAVLLRQVPDVQLAPVLRSLGLPPAAQPRAGEAIAEVLANPDRLKALVADSDDAEREVLDRLAAGPPVGAVRRAHLNVVSDDPAPAQRLLARGLLVPIDAQTVELPREVGIVLRARPLGDVAPQPPDLDPVRREPHELDRLGTTAVLEFLRLVETLADTWAAQPPALLRSGGVGVRELRRTARALGVDESTAALVAEVAHSASLLNSTNGMEPVFLPTPEYDSWRRGEPAARWVALAAAWLAMTRQPTLVNQRSERDRLITVLGPDAERGTSPALRRQVLDSLLALPPGAAPQSREAVLDRLAWHAPRRAAGQRALAAAVLAEADLLGLTAAGGPTGYGRTLLAGSAAAAEAALSSALPEPVDHFVVQPDLTVVVPGPPSAELAIELGLLAELESTGGANVYRISEASVRRAFDAGRTADGLLAFVTSRSRTPVPQALTYLVDDASRRHGVLRAGAASAYLRSDDEALLARVVADRAVSSLGLRRLAPTIVIAAEAPVSRVLDVLREAGYAPAAESPDGSVITLGRDAPRAPSRPPARAVRVSPVAESEGHLAELVRRLRSGDALTELSRRMPPVAATVPGVTSAATMEMLRKAVRESRRVLLGYAGEDGTTSQHVLRPISLAGGMVRGYEDGHAGLVGYAVHRLSAVMLADDDEDDDDPA